MPIRPSPILACFRAISPLNRRKFAASLPRWQPIDAGKAAIMTGSYRDQCCVTTRRIVTRKVRLVPPEAPLRPGWRVFIRGELGLELISDHEGWHSGLIGTFAGLEKLACAIVSVRDGFPPTPVTCRRRR